MEIPVLISHRTAWLVHHAPRERLAAVSKTNYGLLSPTLTVAEKMRRIRHALTDCGLSLSQLEPIDMMVNFDFERTRASGIRCHAFGRLLPTDHLVELTSGILITDEVFTFALASSWMQPLEQLEFGYEICGSYRMGLSPFDPYSEKSLDTSVFDIKKFLGFHPGVHGFKKSSRVARHIRDRSASPAETIIAILLTLPQSQGGLGIRAMELNARVDIPPDLSSLARSKFFKIDALIQRAGVRVGIEYKGGHHDEPDRKGRDAEREAVLAAMGYKMISITSAQLTSQLACHRSINAVANALGIRIDASSSFQAAQNNLRQFLIRNWR